MTCIRNGGATAALVSGYILYPGETRDVPDKIAGLLIEHNPALSLCHKPDGEPPQPALQPQPEDNSLPEGNALPEDSAQVETPGVPAGKGKRK